MSSVGPTRNLFIAGFKSDMTDAALRQLFSGFGTIESAKVMLDIHTGVSRGFAFVLYAQLADAIAAREALNGSVQMTASPDKATIADQFKLTVEFAKHDAYNVVTRNVKVYCRNIPTTATENSVAELMEQWIGKGTVVTVAIMPDSNRSPAMFGARPGGAQPVVKPSGNVAFIEFRTADEAQLAVDTTYNKRIDGPGSVGPLMTKFAETAEVRSERKKRQPNAAANTSPGGAAGASRAVSSQPPSPPVPSVQQQLQHQQQQQHAMMQPYPIMMMNAPPGYPPQPYFVQMMPNAGSLPMLPMMVPTAMMMPPSDSFQRLSNPPPQQAVYAPQPHRQ